MVYLITSSTIIKNATTGLIILFNVGIVCRIVLVLCNSMAEENKASSKIFNLVKAAIVVNSVLGFIGVLKYYYK